jgi:magnesium-transporting ATPase (P-type)
VQDTSLEDLEGFKDECLLVCNKFGYVQNTLIFNAFIFCQLFNEYNARILGNELNMFAGITKNPIFLAVTAFSIIAQICLVEVGGTFVSTTHLTWSQWLITVGLGALSLPVGVLLRFVPVREDPDCFFHAEIISADHGEGGEGGDSALLRGVLDGDSLEKA